MAWSAKVGNLFLGRFAAGVVGLCLLGAIPAAGWANGVDSGLIAYSQKTGIYGVRSDGSGKRTLIPWSTASCGRGCTVWRVPRHPRWSPDGRMLAYFVETYIVRGNAVLQPRRAVVMVARADGSKRRRLGHGHLPTWTPDGKRILYALNPGDPAEHNRIRQSGYFTLRSVDPATGRGTILQHEGSTALSPDGKRMVVGISEVINSDGSEPRRLDTQQAVYGGEPARWNSDGWISYNCDARTGRFDADICMIDPDSGEQRRLPKVRKVLDLEMDASPSGRWYVVGGLHGLYVVRSDGRGYKLLVGNFSYVPSNVPTSPDWQPRGTTSGSPATPEPRSESPAPPPGSVIESLNAQRARHGFEPVLESPELSAGCQAHNRYLALNHRRGAVPFAAAETKGAPGWTTAGAGEDPSSAGAQLLGFADGWDAASRSPWWRDPAALLTLLDPAATAIGYDQAGFRACARVRAGRDMPPGSVRSMPGPGATEIPTSYSGGFAPGPVVTLDDDASVPGTAMLLWRAGADAHVTRATLQAADHSVPVQAFDSRTPLGESRPLHAHTAAIVPRSPLRHDTEYRLHVVFADGSPHDVTFRTRRPDWHVTLEASASGEIVGRVELPETTFHDRAAERQTVLRLTPPTGANVTRGGPDEYELSTPGHQAGRYRFCATLYESTKCVERAVRAWQEISLRRSGAFVIVRSGPARGTVRTAYIGFRRRNGESTGAPVRLTGTRRVRIPRGAVLAELNVRARGPWRAQYVGLDL